MGPEVIPAPSFSSMLTRPQPNGPSGRETYAFSSAPCANRNSPAVFDQGGALAARVMPTILYVRSRLRAAHGEEVRNGMVVFTHLAACALALFMQGIASLLAPLALLILFVRALVGISSRPVPARRVGITELLYGAMLVAAVAAGRALGI